MEKEYSWSWKADSDNYSSPYDTIEECLEQARLEYEGNVRKTIYIGIVEESFDSGVDTDSVIEKIQNDAYSEYGEVAEEYLEDITKEQLNELDTVLNEAYSKWKEKHNIKTSFYNIIEIKEYNLKTVECLGYME